MNRRLIIRPWATRDLDELTDYLGTHSPDAAVRLVESAFEAFDDILVHPEAYPRATIRAARKRGYRKRAVTGFPNHLIYYVVTTEAVDVRRILHSNRDLRAALRDE